MPSSRDIKAKEIVVNVGRGERDADRGVKRRRDGSPQISKADDGISTRRRKPKRGINFYDLGYRKQPDGSYRTLDVAVVPPVVITDGGFTVRPLDLADYTARDAIVLGGLGPVSTWKDKVRRVTKGPTSQRYRIRPVFGPYSDDFLDDLPGDVWTADGLVVTPPEIAGGFYLEPDTRQSAFDAFQIGPNETQRITGLPFFAAPEVTFTPGPEMDVFFMPGFVAGRGQSIASDGIVTVGGGTFIKVIESFAATVFRAFPREKILDPTHPFFSRAHNGTWGYGPGVGLIDYTEAMDAAAFARSLPYFRAVRIDNVSYTYSTAAAFPEGYFPTPPAMPNPAPPTHIGGNALEYLLSPVGPFNGLTFADGVLLAIVVKAGTPFYIWASEP